MRRWIFNAVVVLILSTYASSSNAAESSPAVIAESLFQDAKRLMRDGKFHEACPKLEESQRLDPGGGTLLMWAICLDRQGRTASAWLHYQEALTLAKKENQKDRIELAEKSLAAIEPRLAKLQINVTQASNSLRIQVDGLDLQKGVWNTPVPVDPGSHQINVSDDNKLPWSGEIRITEGQVVEFALPTLENAAPAPVMAPTEPAPKSPEPTPSKILPPFPISETKPASSTQRTLGWILAGTGTASLAVGSIFGAKAILDANEASSQCDATTCPDAASLAISDSAKSSATVSNIAIGAGLATVAIGCFFILTNPPKSRTTSTTPWNMQW